MAENSTEPGRFVPPGEGIEYGYWGHVTDPTPNEAYTVAGVTGGTAQVSDTPTSMSTSDSTQPRARARAGEDRGPDPETS